MAVYLYLVFSAGLIFALAAHVVTAVLRWIVCLIRKHGELAPYETWYLWVCIVMLPGAFALHSIDYLLIVLAGLFMGLALRWQTVVGIFNDGY